MMGLGIELNVLLDISHKDLLVFWVFFKTYSISIAWAAKIRGKSCSIKLIKYSGADAKIFTQISDCRLNLKQGLCPGLSFYQISHSLSP